MLAKFSVKKPFTVFVAIILVIILGVVSYTKMTVDLIPNLNLPYAVVVTTLPGASPEQVETSVSSMLEQTLASISNIKRMESYSMENVSMVMLEFNSDTNMDSSMVEMREQIDMYESMLPAEAGSPMIIKISLNLMPIEVITASAKNMEQAEATKFIENKIIPEIKSVNGVASVTTTGLLENMADVTVSQAKLDALKTKIMEDMAQIIQARLEATVEPMVVEAVTEEVDKAIKEQLAANGATPEAMGEDAFEAVYRPAFEQAYAQAFPAAYAQAVQKAMEETQSSDNASGSDMDITSMLNAETIKGILSADNFSMPAGSVVDQAGFSYAVKVGEKYSSVDEFKSQVIANIPGYGDITIDDVANVTQYNNLENMYSKVNGNPAVLCVIMKQPDFSTAEVTNAVGDKIASLEKQYKAEGIEFSELMNQGDYVNLMVSSIMKDLLVGAVFAIIVILIFLRRIRPTLIVSASILISLVFALVLMYLGGISLNLISMGGLLLAVGMLVDNSIVVIENIFRQRAEGKSAHEAAIDGTNQVGGAIVSSTLTTIIVFVPIVFTTGITKQLFADMGLTIAFSLVASLVVAMTLVPACVGAMKRSQKDIVAEKKQSKLGELYVGILKKSLAKKWVALVVAVVLLGGSVGAAYLTGVEFFPAMDSGQISVSPQIPENINWEDRVKALDKLYNILSETKDAETIGIMDSSNDSSAEGSMMGMMGMMGGGGGSTTVYLLLKEDREKTTNQISDDIRKRVEESDLGFEVEISSSGMDMSMLAGSAVQISIHGNDLDKLRDVTLQVADIVKNTEGVIAEEMTASTDNKQQELRIAVDKDAAILKGLTVAQVFQAVYSNISRPSAATKITQNSLDIKVFVKDESDEYNIDTIGDITVKGKDGDVKVSDIAKITPNESFSVINRINQERVTFVSANIGTDYESVKVNKAIEDKIKKLELPEGVRYEIGGEAEATQKAFNDLYLMIILAVVFIYLIMVAQFQSLLSPFIVMFTLPLAATGGLVALWITGNTISVISLIGFVLLAGVIVNNGIVFVDYANQMRRDEGLSVYESLVKAGRDRLRPILMTALATIAAMAITLFDSGSGAEMIKPMALVNVGGLLYGTLLTLFVVPSLYALLIKDKKAKTEK